MRTARRRPNLERPFLGGDPAERPPGPVFMARGGGGGGRRWDVSFWLWPLPSANPFVLVVEWPAQGIAVTRVAIEVGPLLEASARAQELWSNGEAEAGGRVVFMQMTEKVRTDPRQAD